MLQLTLMKIILKIYGWVLEKSRFIVHFWNDNIMFVTHTIENMWIQKYDGDMSN
jgi:hypothetical protein